MNGDLASKPLPLRSAAAADPGQRRVVVTGMGIVSAIGSGQDLVSEAVLAGRHGIDRKPEWIEEVGTGLAAEIRDFQPRQEPRTKVRGMGRAAQLALRATEEAIADAGLTPEQLVSPALGLAYGSAHSSDPLTMRGSTEPSLRWMTLSSYLRQMGYTCAANLALYFGIQGRVIPTLTGCVSSSLALS